MNKDQCETCRFWQELETPMGERDGECHKNAPLCIGHNLDGYLNNQGLFPRVDPDDWCGEYKERKI